MKKQILFLATLFLVATSQASLKFTPLAAPPAGALVTRCLKVFLDSTDPTTINSGSPANGDNVTVWRDKSGNHYDYTGVAKTTVYPTYITNGIGGKPSMNFSDGHEWFDGGTTNYFSTSTGYSVFLVLNPTSGAPYRDMITLAYQTAHDSLGFFLGCSDPAISPVSNKCVTVQDVNASWLQTGFQTPAITDGLDSVYSFFYNGSNPLTLGNYSAQAQFQPLTTQANPLGGGSVYGNFIGDLDEVNFGFIGKYSGVLVYNCQLTAPEIVQNNSFLNAHFNL